MKTANALSLFGMANVDLVVERYGSGLRITLHDGASALRIDLDSGDVTTLVAFLAEVEGES